MSASVRLLVASVINIPYHLLSQVILRKVLGMLWVSLMYEIVVQSLLGPNLAIIRVSP